MTYITENSLSLIMNCTSTGLEVQLENTLNSGGSVVADSYTGPLTYPASSLASSSTALTLPQNTAVTLATIPAPSSGTNVGRGSFNAITIGNYLNGSWFGSVFSTDCDFEASAEFGS